ncbi:serine/threonine protein kinase, partial [Streptomyces sp. 150FB]
MEQRRPDPVRTAGSRGIGPYHLITRLDPTGPGRPPVPEHRFIASTADGARTVLLSTPLPGTDPVRFAAEAADGRAMPGPWVAGAAELAGPGEPPWYAAPYLPVLPLAAALDVQGGPLPERTVRALGAVLAET